MSKTKSSTAAVDADPALDQLTGEAPASIGDMRSEASAALNHAANCVSALKRSTLEQARRTSGQMREQVGRAGDATVGYIRNEPFKSVLIAAATGATAAVVLAGLARSRSARQ